MAAFSKEAHIQSRICKPATQYMPMRITPFVNLNMCQSIRNFLGMQIGVHYTAYLYA